jgi:DNA-nicking Smr family endonuclease
MLNDTSTNKLLSAKKRLKQAEAAQKLAKQNAAKKVSEKPADDVTIFRDAVKDVKPFTAPPKDEYKLKPKPIPLQFIRDEQQALVDSLSDHYIPAHEIETGEELLYLREGHSPDILSKLRRGHWVIQAKIDLHGLISDEARLYVSTFISNCKKRGIRCVRIVHGKGLGSRNREPVLKHKLRGWLMQKDEVIAFAEAKKQDGGSGAVIVLLKA